MTVFKEFKFGDNSVLEESFQLLNTRPTLTDVQVKSILKNSKSKEEAIQKVSNFLWVLDGRPKLGIDESRDKQKNRYKLAERLIRKVRNPSISFRYPDGDPSGLLEFAEREFFARVNDDGSITHGLLPIDPLVNMITDSFASRGIYEVNIVTENSEDRDIFKTKTSTGFAVQILSKVKNDSGVIERVEKRTPPEEFSSESGAGMQGLLALVNPIFLEKELGFKKGEFINEKDFSQKAKSYLEQKSKEIGEKSKIPLRVNQLSTTESVITLRDPYKEIIKEMEDGGKPKIIVRAHTHFEYINFGGAERNYFRSMKNLKLKNSTRDLIHLRDALSFLSTKERLQGYELSTEGIEFPAYGVIHVNKYGKIEREPHLLRIDNWTDKAKGKLRHYALRALEEQEYAISKQNGNMEGMENFEIVYKVIDESTFPISQVKFQL